MTDKQAVLDAFSRLPDEATLAQIADELLRIVKDRDELTHARVTCAVLTDEDLREYLNPKFEVAFDSVIDEISAENDRDTPPTESRSP